LPFSQALITVLKVMLRCLLQGLLWLFALPAGADRSVEGDDVWLQASPLRLIDMLPGLLWLLALFAGAVEGDDVWFQASPLRVLDVL